METPQFRDIGVSTKTILAKANCTFNLQEIFNKLPITNFNVVKKKRGRRRKDAKPVKNNNLNVGSIIMVKYKNDMRGVDRKNRVPKSTFMRNCVVVELVLREKFVNIKIFNNEKEGNGKFHITGCKQESHSEEGVLHLWKHLREISEKAEDEHSKLFSTTDPEEQPSIVFKTSMTNVNFHLGFQVDREKLNTLISRKKRFIGDFEPSIDTGVKCTASTFEPEDFMLKCITIDEVGNPHTSWVPKDEFKDKRDKEKKVTFLVFQSGKTICSGPYYTEMEKIYNKFIKMISNNRDEIEETIKF